MLQPCVMALEAGDHGDCPHCPPEMSQQHAGHDMTSMAMPCAASGDCGTLDDFNYDGRTAEIKIKKFEGKLLALLPPALEHNQAALPCLVRSTADTDHLSGAAPPLHVLH